tara:strand:+ start:58 stop:846 length:789 start_codon:yes stop_codon:yes gene_type:complete
MIENIHFILAITLPPLIYSYIIYLSSPYKSLKLKDSFSFLMAGVFSIVVVYLFNTFFPGWNVSLFNDPFINNFHIVAPKEELSKYIMFLILIGGLQRDKIKLHPVAYMFYFAMVGLGFALVENIGYTERYGYEVLKIRTFTSTITHMICGLFFGYWIGLGKIVRSKFQSRSVLGIFLNKVPTLKSAYYAIAGFITAVAFHGLWNFNLAASGGAARTISILLLFIGLITAKLLFRDLITQYRKSIEKPSKGALKKFEDHPYNN